MDVVSRHANASTRNRALHIGHTSHYQILQIRCLCLTGRALCSCLSVFAALHWASLGMMSAFAVNSLLTCLFTGLVFAAISTNDRDPFNLLRVAFDLLYCSFVVGFSSGVCPSLTSVFFSVI